MNIQRFIILILIIIQASCVHQYPRVPLDKSKKIQTIEYMKDAYVYAQNNIPLDDNLTRDLIAINKDWEQEFNRSARTNTYLNILALTSLVGIYGSIAQDNRKDARLWLGAALIPFAISIPLGRNRNKQAHKVIESYNSRF